MRVVVRRAWTPVAKQPAGDVQARGAHGRAAADGWTKTHICLSRTKWLPRDRCAPWLLQYREPPPLAQRVRLNLVAWNRSRPALQRTCKGAACNTCRGGSRGADCRPRRHPSPCRTDLLFNLPALPVQGRQLPFFLRQPTRRPGPRATAGPAPISPSRILVAHLMPSVLTRTPSPD